VRVLLTSVLSGRRGACPLALQELSELASLTLLPGGSPGAQFAAGAFVHHIDGVVFALLFVVLVWRKIPLPNTSRGNVGKGLAYSVVLAVISAGLLVPYAYFAKIGLDPFSFGLEQLQQPGPTAPMYTGIGWKLPFAILVWHVVFGFFLGALYDPSHDETNAP